VKKEVKWEVRWGGVDEVERVDWRVRTKFEYLTYDGEEVKEVEGRVWC